MMLWGVQIRMRRIACVVCYYHGNSIRGISDRLGRDQEK